MAKVNNMKRDNYKLNDLVLLVKEDLREFNISENIIETILKSYFKVKSDAIGDGHVINEQGVGTQSLNIRRVSSNFAKDPFTVKLVTNLDSRYKESIIQRMKTDESLQDAMGFEYNE